MSVINKLRQKFEKASALRRQFGTWAVIQHSINQIGDPLCKFEATTIVWLAWSDLNIALDLPEDTQMRFLTLSEIEAFAKNPENDIRESLVLKAQAGTDLCFAGLVDGRLASYGWYSLASEVSADDFGLVMHVPSNAAYMHNGFTHPDFRGRRLHGIGMGRALQALSDRDVDALLSDVDWANHASLRSCWRLGYRNLGNLYKFGQSRFRFACAPRTSRSLGISFERKAVDSAPPQQTQHSTPTADVETLISNNASTQARQTCL